MSGIRKESTVKSVPAKCEEWLTTRNKRKASPVQKPIKKHKASSTPLREITRDNQPFLLTQNSPPPPQLKTCTKQSDIKSFFKSQNQTDHHGKLKTPVQLTFKDDEGIISSDDSDEEDLKENLNLRSQNSPLDKGSIFSRKQIQTLDDEESKPQYVQKESERNEHFKSIYKNDNVVDSPFKRGNCGNLIDQCVGSRKIQVHKPVHRRDLIRKDIHTETTSLLSSNRKEVHHMSSSSKGKYCFDKDDETNHEQERLEQKKISHKEDCEFTEIEFSMPDICSVAANKNSKDKRLTCDRFTCPVCCDVSPESLACSCDNTSCTETSTDQCNRPQLINSEEADQELDNFSLSLNTQYFT
ncbi:uncharacterized protein LOC110440482 isoform X1 [Mizuhopecten yessoensis]|uniref:Uncharacterized protein n=1 Tax=Mizuhopecten yessoensis TaxID=6573 RepID=A0A210R792_MIZYE|nr:uncharacterized protein LOC110440482 isoform X1 [Mizuhopecten yessoensis]OWF56855.1 hypothetical protein KP79_PYT20219 [Mizuhopecten yessoensis]